MTDDLDVALVTRLLETKDVKSLLRYKVKAAHLTNDTAKRALSYIIETYASHGTIPSLALVQENVTDFEPEETDDDLGSLLEHFREKRLYSDLQKAVKAIARASTKAADEGLKTLAKQSLELSIRHSKSNGLDLNRSAAQMKAAYQENKKWRGKVRGIPTPWDAVNKSSKGIQSQDFWCLYGPAGTMKTHLLLEIASHAVENGKRVAFFVYEMSLEQMLHRRASRIACVPYDRFQDGALSKKEEARFFRALDRMEQEESGGFHTFELESARGASALMEIGAKADEVKADLVVLDGIAILSESLDWSDFGSATFGAKRLCQRSNRPLIASHHTNRGGRKRKKDSDDSDSDDIALGETLIRDADVVLRLYRTPQNQECEEGYLLSRKVREGKPIKLVINMKPGVDFSQKFVPGEDEGGEDASGEEGSF